MKLRRIQYQYPGRDAFCLGPLDLEGPDDRPWLVLGPSGSGKSTLLRILGGSLQPDEGEVQGPKTGSSAYLPQFPERALAGRNLAEDLTGQIRPSATERRRLRKALGESGLTGIPLSRGSRTLSAGERRRLGLALIHLSGYEDWSLDEPDAALDAAGHRRLVALLKNRRSPQGSQGRLWIGTHRFELYGPLNPWVLVINHGKKIACGELRSVFKISKAARALSLETRPPFGVLMGLDEGKLNMELTTKNPSSMGSRNSLVRLQLMEKLGIN